MFAPLLVCAPLLAVCSPAPPERGVVGTYYATFGDAPPRLRDIDPNYNLIYLFSAVGAPGRPAGTLSFRPPSDVNGAWTNWVADLQHVRAVQKRRVLLSVGGAGHPLRLTDRAVSTAFVNSVDRLYAAWKGFDGLDLNTFEGGAAPNTPEFIWVGRELKRRHPGFLITAPPAPWNPVDQRFCAAMLRAGALDYCAPQYYDGPALNDPAYLLGNIRTWTELLGPEHVVVGFGVHGGLKHYWTVDSAAAAFQQVRAHFPAIRGVFGWRLDWDARQGYPFARRFGPLVR
jgi:chitinase